jgi:hypothetical protein
MVDIDGGHRGENPVRGLVTVTWEMDDGSEMEEDVEPTISQGKSWIDIVPPQGAKGLLVRDVHGNEGSTEL